MKPKRGTKGSKVKSATEQAMSKALMGQSKGSRAVEKMMEVGRGDKPAPKTTIVEKAFPFQSKEPMGKNVSRAAGKIAEPAQSKKAVGKAPNSRIADTAPRQPQKEPNSENVIRKPRHGGVFIAQNPWGKPQSSSASAFDAPSSDERRPSAASAVVEEVIRPLRSAAPEKPVEEQAPRSLEEIVAMAAARRDAPANKFAPAPTREAPSERRPVAKEPKRRMVSPFTFSQPAGQRIQVTTLGSSTLNTLSSATSSIIESGGKMLQNIRSRAGKICCPSRDDAGAEPPQRGRASGKKEGAVEAAYNTASVAAGKTAAGMGAIMSGAKKAVGYIVKGALEAPVDLFKGVLSGADALTHSAKMTLGSSSREPRPARK